MLKRYCVLLLIIFLVVASAGCGQKNTIDPVNENGEAQPYKTESPTENTTKETTKKPIAVKGDMIVSEDGWIYYSDFANRLSRVRTDGTNLQVLAEHDVVRTSDFVLNQDWIYFVNWVEDDKLFKLKRDGTELVKLSDDTKSGYINVEQDWVYYSFSGITRTKTDGSYKELVLSNPARNLSVKDGWIYYEQTARDDSHVEESLYKIRVGGTGRTELSDAKSGNYVIDGEWIYFNVWVPGKGHLTEFYKIKTDGNDMQRLSEDWIMYVNVHNNLIYYSNASDAQKLYRMKTNGEENTKLSDEHTIRINILNDTIYYVGENFHLSRINLNGTNPEKILN